MAVSYRLWTGIVLTSALGFFGATLVPRVGGTPSENRPVTALTGGYSNLLNKVESPDTTDTLSAFLTSRNTLRARSDSGVLTQHFYRTYFKCKQVDSSRPPLLIRDECRTLQSGPIDSYISKKTSSFYKKEMSSSLNSGTKDMGWLNNDNKGPLLVTLSISLLLNIFLVLRLWGIKFTPSKFSSRSTSDSVSQNETDHTGENSVSGTSTSGDSSWLVVGDSVSGLNHEDCEDSHYYRVLEDSWGIAVVADGKGSASNPQLGSKIATDEAPDLFQRMLNQQGWVKEDGLPSDKDWDRAAKLVLHEVKDRMQTCAEEKGVPLKSLACTIIVAVYSTDGILMTHIGDGRAAYKNKEGEWKSMMEPWEGEEAGATVFLTSEHVWFENTIDTFIETRVIRESPEAFTLLSDGCAEQAFRCWERVTDDTIQKWKPANEPYPKFLDPLVENLQELSAKGTSKDLIKRKWTKFLEEGNKQLKNEGDDKTMILGIRK